jgi:hypothetical protein
MLNRCRTRLASPSQRLYALLTRPHPRPETTRVHVEEIAVVSDEQRLVFWSSHTRIVRCWVNAVSERQKTAGSRPDGRQGVARRAAGRHRCLDSVRLGPQTSRGRSPLKWKRYWFRGWISAIGQELQTWRLSAIG